MVEVTRGYRNSQGALTGGSVVATIGYDGLSRRIVKDVGNSGDWDCAYHFYYSGQRMIETRNGSDNVLKQHVWGLGYVDELVQIGINLDPAEHWIHLRTTNPIESTFATVRLRHPADEGFGQPGGVPGDGVQIDSSRREKMATIKRQCVAAGSDSRSKICGRHQGHRRVKAIPRHPQLLTISPCGYLKD